MRNQYNVSTVIDMAEDDLVEETRAQLKDVKTPR